MSLVCPPILVVYFNRPDVLRRSLNALSRISPSQLFFACDGPRENVASDRERVEECQKIAGEMVDWDCTVEVLLADRNYGCDSWVPLAVTWFFSKVEAGIILEDDCIINGEFARFAAELLEKYKEEPSVMNISAANFQGRTWGRGDYYFSGYPSNWGWASWARAWRAYDGQLEQVERFMQCPNGFSRLITDTRQRAYWMRFYNRLRTGKVTFWDAKWLLSIWSRNGVSITPNRNLVSNIGFGSDATHTKNKTDQVDLKIARLGEVLIHPNLPAAICAEADQYLFESRYKPQLTARLRYLVARLLSK